MSAESTARRAKLSRNVIALGLVSLFTDASTEIVYPLLPLFLTAIGAGPLFVGLIESIAETTASLLKLIAGWLSDRLGKRKAVVLAGYGLSSATRPLMALAAAPWHVLVVRFADRVGKGFRGAPRDALIADSSDPSIRGRAFGFHRAMDHTGAVVGPLIAFALLQTVFRGDGAGVSANTYRLVFWAATIPAVLAVLTLLFLVREVAPSGGGKRNGLSLSLRGFSGTFKAFLVVLILFTLGNSSDMFLILRANDLGISAVWVPILWVALHIVKSLSSVPGSAWSDRVGRKRAIQVGWAVYALIYAGFAYATSVWHAWALFAAYGIYFGLTEGTEKALIADLVPSELRSTAYGIYGFAIGIAALPSSLLMGYLWQTFGVHVAFLFGASLALVAMLLLWALRMPARPVSVHHAKG
ncbi:MFS transporter [Candidatus Poribacteria bacterium]|nr:MFS transporter [Candidatus Poribacteria bacterium]